MDGYRDERGAAIARLEQLEAEHRDRLVEKAPERRMLLEATRVELQRRPSGVSRSGLLVVAATLVVLVLFLNMSTGSIATPPMLSVSIVAGLVMMAVFLAGDLRESRERARRIAAVDTALRSLEAPRVGTVPTELEAIHVRIAELEADESPAQAERVDERRDEMASVMAESRK